MRVKHVGLAALTVNVGLMVSTLGQAKEAQMQNLIKGALAAVNDEVYRHAIESKPVGFKRPVLPSFASEDQIVSEADHHDKLMAAVTGAQSVEIPGAGHLPHPTRTDEVVSAIDTFIEQLS